MKHHLATKTLTAQDLGSHDIRYFKMVYTVNEEGSGHPREIYGVHVEKYLDGAMVDQASSGPIAEGDEEITAIIMQIADGLVTPMVLFEILDEMVS